MPYLGEARNAMLETLVAKIKAISVLEAKSVTETFSGAAGKILKTAGAHGLLDKDIVVLQAGFTGGTGLIAGRAYYVRKVSATEVELFMINALENPVEWASTASEVKLKKLVELKATRATCVLGTPVNGVAKDTTTRTIAVLGTNTFPASYEYIGFYSALTEGTLHGVEKVQPETLNAAVGVEVKETQVELDAVA